MKSSNLIERRGVKIQKIRSFFVVIPTIKVNGRWIDSEKGAKHAFSKWVEVCGYLRDNYYQGEVSIKNEANTEYIYLDKNPNTRYL